MIAVPRVGSSEAQIASIESGPVSAKRVDRHGAVSRALAAELREDAALVLEHAGQIGLDVGQPIAVARVKPPAARREPCGDLDDLADRAGLDLLREA